MAFSFPDDPVPYDTYERYTWDGEKWSLSGEITPVDFITIEFNELFGVMHPGQLFTLPTVP